ncbi:MAG: type II secretion system protein [Saccharofermentanaceae bacterium]|jgi:prepilin-type N-terminal cleavage/methylation domain-containing protein|nr:type II secretion system protein [Clostridia bacterium]NLX68973.1 type II secretion system protein [Clostridiaceae bacterium]HOO48862.1 type II secretion system protein [Saccharofermentans sp.]HPG63914.1 type II secretion system protein [Saccharofermentans sp.]HPJ81706.1 type II secretion system protein [Saccharofermentans sp.]
MRKFSKNKKAFTLVEMVIVLAILCMLAAALTLTVSDYINKAKTADSKITEKVGQMSNSVSAEEAEFVTLGF